MGIYNATGPEKPLPMKVDAGLVPARPPRTRQTLSWVPEKFLEEHKGDALGTNMPVWTGKEAGFSQIDCKKAIGKGLKFRPADEGRTGHAGVVEDVARGAPSEAARRIGTRP